MSTNDQIEEIVYGLRNRIFVST